MKIRLFLTRRTLLTACCAVSLFGLGACKDKPEPEVSEPSSEQASGSAGGQAEPVEIDSSGYNSKRTQAFGFLSRMPATTEGALGVRDLSRVVDGFLKSETFGRVSSLMGESGGFDLDSVQMAQAVIDQYVGKEVFLIMTEGTALQYGRLQFILRMANEASFRNIGAELVDGAGDDQMALMRDYVVTQLKDENSEMSKSLEGLEFPPLIMGSKVTDGAQEVIDQLDALEAELPPVFTVSDFEAGGGKFTSWKINLQDVFNAEAEEGLNEFFEDAALSARVAAIIRKKTIEFSFGVMDNYLVFALGSDHKHLSFVSKPQESILATQAFGFADQFLGKPLVSYAFMSRPLLASGAPEGQIQHMADSFASGLAPGGPAMRKLGDLVKNLGGQMEEFAKVESQTYVGVNYFDRGLHGESTGGYVSDVIDPRAKSLFANAAPADAALVISSVANPKYRAQSIAMIETLFSGVKTGVEAYAESSGDDSVMEQYAQMNEVFGGNLTKIWGILKGKFIEGLGSQSGIIVDLKGGMPKGLPVPNVLVKEGKVPRIALAADVKDRAKLAAAWEQLVPALNDTLESIPGQEPGSEVQVPGVVSLDSDELVTHHFSLPFITPDFIPSISLSDELFFLSTSKQFSEDLAAGTKAGSGEIRGAYVMMNFKELHRFVDGWVKLGLSNADTLFGDEIEVERFKESAGKIQMGLEFTRGIHGFKFNRYTDDAGAWRASWHLHIEDLGAQVD